VKFRKSKSGFYKVELARTVPVAGFDYKPGRSHVVNQETLDAMLAEEGAVTHVHPSE
jgi:hypothetical protein